MMTLMRLFAICAILLALACSTPAQQPPAVQTGQAESDVAARVGDRAITLKELDDRWRTGQPADHAQAVQKMYDGRKDALDAIVAEMLIEQAAKAKGVTPTQFSETEMTRRAKP